MRSLYILALLAFAAASGAQPLTTDRPDFTESPLAVEQGRFQIELGTTFEEAGSEGPLIVAPEALVRLGVLPFAEIRLGLPNYLRFEGESRATGTRADDGWTDPSVGLKLELGSLAGVDLAFLGSTSIPVDENAEVLGTFGSNRLVPSFLLIAGTDLAPGLSLGTQGGITYNGPGADDADLAATLVFGYSLADQIGAFAEVAISDRVSVDAPASILVHTGATLLLSDDVQLDAHVGAGLTETAPDYLVGIGASARF
ncbi:transporter [Rubricoccus marinus]|uniref:Transporter n=1 Tax=Rubricoccus marinus TaxID=716817 RepID=A0A259U2T6_9BACT|nr:transporter [Rubricoccus marinus]OZC04167.1 hypothetical protein BSZ36_14960 [Rubricoccus marinus]